MKSSVSRWTFSSLCCVSLLWGGQSSGAGQMPMPPTGRMPRLDMRVPETSQLKPPQPGLPMSGQGMKSAVQAFDLDALLALARQNNPTLVQAHQQTVGEAGKAKEAGLWYNPNFSYAGSTIGTRGEGDERRHTAGEFEGLNIEQRIVTAHKLGLSRDKYKAREEAAQAEESMQARRVENDVRIRYYETLAALELSNITEEMLKTAQDHWLTTKEQFNEGQATQVEYHLANAELEQTRLRRELARNDYRLHVGRLAAVVGVDLSAAKLTGHLGASPASIQVIDYDQALNKVLADSPELAEAKAKLKSDEITLHREKVAPIPDIFLRGGYGYDDQTRQPVFNAGFTVEVPFFDRNQGTVASARADWERQKAEVRRIDLSLRDRFAEQYGAYLTALQHVEDYEAAVLPETKTALETQLNSYKDDRATWPQVLMRERDYNEQRALYIASLLAWRVAETQINGLLLSNGLMAPQGVTPPGHIDAVRKPR